MRRLGIQDYARFTKNFSDEDERFGKFEDWILRTRHIFSKYSEQNLEEVVTNPDGAVRFSIGALRAAAFFQ